MLQALRDRTNRALRRTLVRTRDAVDRRLERLEERRRELETAKATGEAPPRRRHRTTRPAEERRRRRRGGQQGEPPQTPPQGT